MNRKIAVIGLGYVGLPVALAFARKFPGVVGFDINENKVAELQKGIDRTGEVSGRELSSTSLKATCDPEELKEADFFIVAVPTPIDKARRPDLTALIRASETVGRVMREGSIVVYESTVYPGVTEEICGPVLARVSGLKQGKDFKLGYSPERINPGDRLHRLETIVKVVSGEDRETLETVAGVYGEVVKAGVYRASSIKVAEAAKVIENTQRDLNIALMNELAVIFEKMGIRTSEVLEAAGTKWNFLPFRPGLVGGHCIGVDPYYLTFKAEELGYHPQVILAGRRINDGMGKYVAEQAVKRLSRAGKHLSESRVGILGLTFKEDVPDLRNSRVPDIVAELGEYGMQAMVHDPLSDPQEALEEYGIQLVDWEDLKDLDAVILAVAHKEYRQLEPRQLTAKLKKGSPGVIIDVKSVFKEGDFPEHVSYWSL
ncbi:MAG: nucleotide sugar dehydrogenase [Peptococcaceae bacterium]|jgi:UDP-N-acetyl-D-galactosamine dehydrogenase|nr:nucleotide sugar dehydrogenase [Peptococcaceae bacterium]MDH7525998.1 nucleotide sugar dehydrogenase [Peptococcaceae bacterium]